MGQVSYKPRSFLCEMCTVDTTRYVAVSDGSFYCEACAKEAEEADKLKKQADETKKRWEEDGF